MTTSMTDYLKVGFGIFYMISAIYGNGLSIENKLARRVIHGPYYIFIRKRTV